MTNHVPTTNTPGALTESADEMVNRVCSEPPYWVLVPRLFLWPLVVLIAAIAGDTEKKSQLVPTRR